MIDVDAARTFMHSYARLLDRRRFQHAFDDAPAELVLAAVTAYRNPEGGFGALEPDLRAPSSQPIPTRYALDVLAELPPCDECRALALGALDWLATVTNADGSVPFVLPSGGDQPAAFWLQPSPESSLLATAQLAAAAHRLELDHPWLARATAYCWGHVRGISPAEAYTFRFSVDFLDAVPDRARADAEIDRLTQLMPADGRIVVTEGVEGEELDPLVIAMAHPCRRAAVRRGSPRAGGRHARGRAGRRRRLGLHLGEVDPRRRMGVARRGHHRRLWTLRAYGRL